MCLLRKILMRLRGMNFCTSSAHFALSFVRQLKGPECIQIEQHTQNTSLGPNRVNRVRSLQKISTRLHGTNFCTTSAGFARSFVRQPNSPKCTQIVWNKTHQNLSLHPNGVNPVCLLQKIKTRLRGTNFCTCSAHFALSFVRQPNGPECIQIVQNAPERLFRVQ